MQLELLDDVARRIGHLGRYIVRDWLWWLTCVVVSMVFGWAIVAALRKP